MARYDFMPPLIDATDELLELNWASVQLRADKDGVRFAYYDGKTQTWKSGPSLKDDPKAFAKVLSHNLWYPDKWTDDL